MAFAFIAFNTHSIHDVSMLGFPVVILLAGLLLGTRGSLTYAILAGVIADFLAYADLNGITGTYVRGATGYDDLLIVPSILIITALILNLLISRLDMLVKRAQRSEQQEAAANQELRALQGQLEQRVSMRTEQLHASADVGRAAVSILDTNQLLREIVNLITDRFGFYYAAVFLADSTRQVGRLARSHRRRRPRAERTPAPTGSRRPVHGGLGDEDAQGAHRAGCGR